MKTKQTPQTSATQTSSNCKSRLSKICWALGIMAIIIAFFWAMIPTEAGTISSASQIQAQMEFQKELIKGQEQFQQQIDYARKVAEQKSGFPKNATKSIILILKTT